MVPSLHDSSDTESEILCITLGIVISERCGHGKTYVLYWVKAAIVPH